MEKRQCKKNKESGKENRDSEKHIKIMGKKVEKKTYIVEENIQWEKIQWKKQRW